MDQRFQRGYSRMQPAELSGRMRRVDNRRLLNNPRMVGGPRVSSPLVREAVLSYGAESSWEEEGCESHVPTPRKVTACPDASARQTLPPALADTRGPADARDPDPGRSQEAAATSPWQRRRHGESSAEDRPADRPIARSFRGRGHRPRGRGGASRERPGRKGERLAGEGELGERRNFGRRRDRGEGED